MCLAIPMRVAEISGKVAVAEVDGLARRVRVDLLDGIRIGDYVLVHAGLAIAKVDEDEARATLSLLRGITNEVQ
ncbi:MAG: HypC/HybG/HupF family hydrogenase formation chaperone [Armatimonadetes bacterium]|nr:HypC/HybG/HupF family hydrogenase formation chaperone [Armatimonadota bacterium]